MDRIRLFGRTDSILYDWPSHSSLFGVVDLAGLPKDRYFLYRSHWNKEQETLHVLPHWNWEGREGEVTPVFVYTNYPSAELFINGKSREGVRKTLALRYITVRFYFYIRV